MQRGAGSPASSPSTPSEPPAKRQRLSNGTSHFTPSSTPRSRIDAVESPLSTGRQTPVELNERNSPNYLETQWYLSVKEPTPNTSKSSLRIVSAGYSTLDAATAILDHSSDDEEDDSSKIPKVQGRRSFGKFNRKIEVRFHSR